MDYIHQAYAQLIDRFAQHAIQNPDIKAETLFLLVMALLLTVLVFAALMALVAAVVGATTALIAYWLKRWLPIPLTVIGTNFAIIMLVNLSVIVNTGPDLFDSLLQTYLSMSMLTSFNPLFLVYVALFSLSLFAFILNRKHNSVNIAQFKEYSNAHPECCLLEPTA